MKYTSQLRLTLTGVSAKLFVNVIPEYNTIRFLSRSGLLSTPIKYMYSDLNVSIT